MLTLTGAFGPYDRTEALRSGSVRPERIDLTCLTLYPPEIFYRMCRYQEFEVSEMSMGSHCFFWARGKAPSSASPPFPAGCSAIRWCTSTMRRGLNGPRN